MDPLRLWHISEFLFRLWPGSQLWHIRLRSGSSSPLTAIWEMFFFSLFNTKCPDSWILHLNIIIPKSSKEVFSDLATRAGCSLALFKSTDYWFFFVVPILMGVLSVTSIFSKLAKGVCFALASHFNFIRFIHTRALFVAFRCWTWYWQLFVCF